MVFPLVPVIPTTSIPVEGAPWKGGPPDDPPEVVDLDDLRSRGRDRAGRHDRRGRAGRERRIDVPHAVGAQPRASEEHEPRLDAAAVHREAADRRVAGQSRREPQGIGEEGANVHAIGA